MKTLTFGAAALFCCLGLSAAGVPQKPGADDRTERAIRESLPVCGEARITRTPMERPLPQGVKASLVKIESPRQSCEGQYVSLVTSLGGFYLGYPWFLDGESGTIEEKLKTFTWSKLKQNMTATVTRTRSKYGFYPVTLTETTAHGKYTLEGEVDPEGTLFLLGGMRALGGDARSLRVKSLDASLATAPATGSPQSEVTVVEFSDFECPSCKHASGYVKPILEKHRGKVRYVRYDLPLINMHQWALSAAVAGRAIHRQNPELFWKFKERVYAEQDKLSAFTIDDFSRGFAADHELDLKRYDADVASAALREEILRGIGLAFSNEVRATPTYMVNGVFVDAGEGGKALVSYVDALLAKRSGS